MATSTEQPKQSNPLAVGNSSVVNSEALIVVNDVKLILPPPPSTPTLSQQRNVMLHQQRLSRSSVMLPDTVTATRPPSAPISEYAPPGQRVNNTVVTTIPRLHSLSADNTAAEINQPVEKLPPTRSSPRPSALSEETSSVTSDSTESSEESAPQIVITDSAGHSVQKTATEAETDGNKKDIEMDVFSRHSFEWVGPRISSEGARPSLELLRRARIRPVYHPYYFRQFVTEHMPAKGTVVEAVSNIANSILASGVVCAPYALTCLGLPFGIITFFAVAAITDISSLLLVYIGEKVSIFDYEGLCYKAFGKFGFFIISLFMYLQSFGTIISYVIMIGDTFTAIMQRLANGVPVISDRRFITVFLMCVIVFPLTLWKSVNKLAYSAYLSMFSVVFIFVTVIAQCALTEATSSSEASTDFKFIHSSFPLGIGVVAFTLVCHHNNFIIYQSLKQASLFRWGVITHSSLLISLSMCLTVSIVSYLEFFDTTQGNVLNNFSNSDTLINVTRALLGFSIIFAIPLEHYVTRAVMLRAFFYHPAHQNLKYYGVTICQMLAFMLLGTFVTNLGVVLSLMGGVVTSCVGFVIPGVLCLKLSVEPLLSRKKIFSMFLVGFGGFLLVSCPIMLAYQMATG